MNSEHPIASSQDQPENQPGCPALNEQGCEKTLPAERPPCVTKIVLTCSPGVLAGMVAAYETAIEKAAGELPLLILWAGPSQKYGHGIIILEWIGTVSEAFLHDLDIDEEVFDYMFYEDERVSPALQEAGPSRTEPVLQDSEGLSNPEKATAERSTNP